jgi:DNA-binding NarL/FixJ family response regulator
MPSRTERQVIVRRPTTQEQRVLEGLAAGKSQSQVARDMQVSRQRVHTIVERLRLDGVIANG